MLNILKLNKKYINIKKIVNYSKELLKETFGEEDTLTRFDKNKLRFKEKIKFTDDELDQIQKEIPEFRRNALTIKNIKNSKTLINKLSDNFGKDEDFREMREELDLFKDSYNDIKDGVKNKLNISNNFLFKDSKLFETLKQSVSFTEYKEAILYMKQFDDQFNIENLQEDCKFIFYNILKNHFKDNIEEVKDLIGEKTLVLFENEKSIWDSFNGIPFSNDFYIGDSLLERIVMGKGKDRTPKFIIRLNVKINNCLIDKTDENKVVFGEKSEFVNKLYVLLFEPNEDIDILKHGHYWKLTEYSIIDDVKFLF